MENPPSALAEKSESTTSPMKAQEAMKPRTRPVSQPTKAIRRAPPRGLPEAPARIATRVTLQAQGMRKRLRAKRPRLIATSVSTLRAISARGSRLLCAAKVTIKPRTGFAAAAE